MANANINININSKNAEKSLTTLQADIEATNEELSRLIKVYGENSKEADKMRKTLVGLEVEMNKLGGSVEMAEGSTQSLKAQLRELQNELARLEPGSARFQELSNKAAGLKEQIQDANDVVKVLAGNTSERLIRGLGGAVQIGVAGFQALQSSLVLFGVENEEVSKSIQKMTALLNLSQALETFAGLDQKIVEVKASISSLTGIFQKQNVVEVQGAVAAGATTLAMEGQAVATTTAAGATTLLGTAMKALPIVAIAAAVGTLVYAIYDYISSSSDAEKQEKKREETLKRQNEEQKKTIEFVAKESNEFTTLIYQLKSTNKNSERRNELIKQINKQYGTTLKNLSDENEFQEQLNVSVKEYIALQYNKFKLQKNEEYIQGQNEKRFDIEQKLFKLQKDTNRNFQLTADQKKAALGDLAAEVRFRNELALKYRDKNLDDTIELKMVKDIQKQYKELKKGLEDVETSSEKLGLRREQLLKVEDDLTKGGKKYVEQLEKEGDAGKTAADALKDYEGALTDIQKITEETIKVEEENFLKSAELSKKKVDLVEIERNKRTESVRKQYNSLKTYIEKEITDETRKYELLTKLQTEFGNFETKLNEQSVLDKRLTNQKIFEEQIIFLQTLLQEEKALQNEIRFGDGDTSDTLIVNTQKVLENSLKALETEQIKSELQSKLSLKRFTQLQIEKRDKLILFSKLEQEGQIQALKAERDRLVDLEKQKYDIKEDFLIEEDKLTGKISVKIKEDRIKQFQGGSEEEKKILENLNTEKVLLEKNLNTTVENLDKNLNTKLESAAVESANKIAQINADSEDEIFNKRVQKLDEYIGYAEQAFSQFNSVVQQAQEQRLEQQSQLLDDFVSVETEKLNQQLENRLISQEEYDSRVKQLETQKEQELLALKRKQFQQDKALNIVQATIDAARGTLSAFANTPTGIIGKTIAAGLAAAFGAIQIGLIAKQEFRAAIGGIVPSNGMSGNVDSVPATLAPGEAVINSNSTSAFLPVLDLVNRLGGGKSLMPEMPGDNGLNRFQPVYQQQQSNQPVRAYVVSSDIENNMGKLNRIRRSTRF